MKTMKKIVLVLALAFMGKGLMAQTETFDITTYTPPKGWKKEIKAGTISYTITDSVKNTYCIIGVYAGRPSSGDALVDFKSDWNELAVKVFGADANPKTEKIVTAGGGNSIVGASLFKNQGVDNAILLTSFSAYGKVVSVVTLMNSGDFQAEVQKFLDSITFSAPPVSPRDAPGPGRPGQPSTLTSSFRDVTFTAPKGWTQTNYTDGIGLQSPEMECGSNSNYKIIIYNNRPFAGDLKKQVRDVWFELFNPVREGEVEMKKWSSPEGWEFLTFENDMILSRADDTRFHGRVLLVRQGSQVSVISLQSNRTADSQFSNNLKCNDLETAWKRFVASLQFKGPRGDVNATAIPEELLGRWESKMTTGVSYYGAISSQILAAYTFRDNGYCKSKSLFNSDADGRFTIKGNRITITSPGGMSETFIYRVESKLVYTYWHKYLCLTDKNGNESRLLFLGD